MLRTELGSSAKEVWALHLLAISPALLVFNVRNVENLFNYFLNIWWVF